MLRLEGRLRDYAWGSRNAIPELLGVEPDARPVAELWFGAHAATPSLLATPSGPEPLDAAIASAPDSLMGADVVARFGPQLPYLLKVIAADRPLSLQVHPNLDRARDGFELEEAAGIPVDDPRRNYKDRNHKPELVYALTRFEALCGFRAPRRAAELLTGLDAPLAVALQRTLSSEPSYQGIRTAFRRLLAPEQRPTAADIDAVASACAARLADGSPSPRADR
ncbi:MAG TPA: mannose-6-phosphate isomerase, class I, partial [Actinotalea sp.]